MTKSQWIESLHTYLIAHEAELLQHDYSGDITGLDSTELMFAIRAWANRPIPFDNEAPIEDFGLRYRK